MPLETTRADITNRLHQGRFPNEQSISQGIVLRLIVERPRDRELQPELLSNFAGELQDHICEGSAIAA